MSTKKFLHLIFCISLLVTFNPAKADWADKGLIGIAVSSYTYTLKSIFSGLINFSDVLFLTNNYTDTPEPQYNPDGMHNAQIKNISRQRYQRVNSLRQEINRRDLYINNMNRET